MPIREPYTSKDGRHYPLWIDIDDVMKTLISIYWFKQREDRQQKGMMFRGHADAEWDLVPTLFRPPADEKIFKRRRQYTQDFMDALVKIADHLQLKNLSELKLLAIAQHYGFYTHLLDFSRNIEVAAYFATRTEHPPKIGAIFAYHVHEYNGLRNPLAALGTSLEDSEKFFGDRALPPLLNENFDDVPRIYHQEGLFIECPVNKVKAVQENCIDRYYFHQRPDLAYQGQFAFETGLPGPRLFTTKDAYTAFMEIARREHPELFQQTSAFSRGDLFPPIDPLSVFAVEWKKANPDPTVTAPIGRKLFHFLGKLFGKSPDTSPAPVAVTTQFAAAVDNYYFDRERRTPYQVSVIQRGREMIESLCKRKELDDPNNQRWLLGELLRLVTKEKYSCTVKLNNTTSTSQDDAAFNLLIIDRWLEGTYSLNVPVAQVQQGFWRVRFDKTHYARGDEKPEIHPVPQLFSLQKQYQPIKGNPYRANAEIKRILTSINKTLKNCAPGEDGSFVYDLQCILMRGFGRDLQLIVGLGNIDNCCFFSPLVDMDCEEGKPQLVVEIYEGFFHALKRTSVCSKHWERYCEGDINLFSSSIEFSLGLA
jgi:hypothetical protein